MTTRHLTRWQAAPIHLAISATIAAAVFAVCYFIWYPGALFDTAGGRDLFLLIACVDVTVGPLITLIIFVPGKRGLRFDLWVIAIVQLAALCYGTYVLFESRPVWIVFVKDRFELVRANDIRDEERAKAKPPFDALSITGPPVVGARLPTDPDEQLKIMISAAQGLDVQTYPQYLVPYDEVRKQVTAKAAPLAQLVELNPDQKERISALPARTGLPETRVGFVPMRAGKRDLAVLVDRSNGDFLGSYELRPWKY